MNESKILENAISSMNGETIFNNQDAVIPGYGIKFPKNIHVEYEAVNGIKYPRVAWSDIKLLYPSNWILYTNFEKVYDDREFLCTILEVCDNDHKSEEKIRLYKEGYQVMSLRTKSMVDIGVL